MRPLGRTEKLIYWVDIPGRQLHRYDPETGRDDHAAHWEMGCFALAERGGFICGMRSGYARLDRFDGAFTHLASPDYDRAKPASATAAATAQGASGAGTMEPRDRAPADSSIDWMPMAVSARNATR